MRIFRIGRGAQADIGLTDDSVSRDHADLIAGQDGRYYFIDRQSGNGSYRWTGTQWARLSREVVAREDRVRLGTVETTIGALIERIAGATPAGKLERGPDGIPHVTPRR